MLDIHHGTDRLIPVGPAPFAGINVEQEESHADDVALMHEDLHETEAEAHAFMNEHHYWEAQEFPW